MEALELRIKILNYFWKTYNLLCNRTSAKTKIFKKIVVSTDSYKIKKISEKAERMYFFTTKKLSNHTTPIIDVISHAIKN